MNRSIALLGSLTFGVCTSLAQTPPPAQTSLAAGSIDTAVSTRHGRVQGVMATPDGTINGLFLGGRIAVSLPPEISRQLASLPVRGREVTVSGPSRTIDGSVTVEAQSLRIGGNTFIAPPAPQIGFAAPPPGRPGDPRAPGHDAPPPPPSAGGRAGGAAPLPPPPPAPSGGIAQPPAPASDTRGRDQGTPPAPPPALPGVNSGVPVPPPPADGSLPVDQQAQPLQQ